MGSGYLMALDAGGGSARCLLLDVESGTSTIAARALRHPVAPGTEGWGYELDAPGLWHALGSAAREALARAGVKPGQVAAVAATGMRHGMVLVDAGGQVLWAVPNRDARAAGQGLELAASRGPELGERTGHWPSPIAVAARLLWLRENAPRLLAGTAAYLSISEWLAFKLCGRAVAEPSQAGETSLFELATGTWALDLARSLALPAAIFPEVRPAGSPLGQLTAEAAAALGLQAGTPVALGGADTQCALLGLGVVEPGQVAVIAGTTVPVQLVAGRPVVDRHATLWTGCHVVPGRWVVESNAGTAGEALDWLGALLLPGQGQAVAQLAAEAALAEQGAGGFLSSLGAQLFHASRLSLPVATLSFSHLADPGGRSSVANVARAVLEGLACSVRGNLDQLLEVDAGQRGAPLALVGELAWVPFRMPGSDELAAPRSGPDEDRRAHRGGDAHLRVAGEAALGAPGGRAPDPAGRRRPAGLSGEASGRLQREPAIHDERGDSSHGEPIGHLAVIRVTGGPGATQKGFADCELP